MLSLVIGITSYPALDAEGVREFFEQQGFETDWWWDKANTVDYVGGCEPSEAYLLLPYSVVRLLSKDTETDTTDDEDDEGLNGAGVVTNPGQNIYDRIIRIHGMIYQDLEEEDEVVFLQDYYDTSGWFFLDSKAIDPARNPCAAEAVHLARFVDIRGIERLISGNLGTNINIVAEAGLGYTEDATTFDYSWVFDDLTATSDTAPTRWDSWEKVTDWLWAKVRAPLPNEKYEDTPEGFEFPEYPFNASPAHPGNDRPHNLNLKHLSVWQGFCRYVQLIHHEIFPTFEGTFVVTPIHAHTNDPIPAPGVDDRKLKLRLGTELSKRIHYLIDQDANTTSPLIPHSYVGVFTKLLGENHLIPFTPIYLWRGPGTDPDPSAGEIPVTDDSLFIHALLKDDAMFTDDYMDDHPYIPAGPVINEGLFGSGDATVTRSRAQYLDCTFFCVLSSHPENFTPGVGDSLDIDEDSENHGSHSHAVEIGGESNPYPVELIATKIAKWHLKTRLHGDLGTIILSGFHQLLPSTLHQRVIFDAKTVTTTLEGAYTHGKQFTRDVATRNLWPTDIDVDDGLAVVFDNAVAAATPTGAAGDFSTFSQPVTTGNAVKVKFDAGNLVPDIPPGGTITDAIVEFSHARDDAQIIVGALVFIKDGLAHLISSVDYLKGVPNGTTDPVTDRVLVKQAGSDVVWAPGADFQGEPGADSTVPGPPGDDGPTYTGGCGIIVAGTVIHIDPSEIIGCGLAVASDNSSPEGPCRIVVDLADIAGCGLVAATDNQGDGNGPCKLKVDLPAIIGEGLEETAGNQADGNGPCKMQLKLGCGLEFSGGAVRIKRSDLIGSGLAADSGTCNIKVAAPAGSTINSITGISLSVTGGDTLVVTVDYTPYTVTATAGTPAQLTGSLAGTECATP